MFELAKNGIKKSAIVFNIYLKKILEFLLCYLIFSLKAIFLLMLLLNYYFAEK